MSELDYPRGVTDPNGPRGDAIQASTDRRLLWHLETMLAVSGTTETHRREQRKLSAYLHSTCEHEWLSYPGDDEIPAHDQCLWCNEVEWQEDQQ